MGFPKVISQTQWGGFVISWGWARELEIDSFSSLTFDFCSTPSFSATPSHIHTDRTLAFGLPRDLPLAFSGDFWPMCSRYSSGRERTATWAGTSVLPPVSCVTLNKLLAC